MKLFVIHLFFYGRKTKTQDTSKTKIKTQTQWINNTTSKWNCLLSILLFQKHVARNQDARHIYKNQNQEKKHTLLSILLFQLARSK